MRPRVIVIGIALWLGVVTAGSGITWLVIDRVGRDVVTSQAVAGEDPVAVPPAGSRPPTRVPSATPGHERSSGPRPGGPASGAPSTSAQAPGAGTTVVPSPHPPRTSEPNPTERPPRTPSPDESRPVTRTWSGTGGRVTVSCAGTRVSLVSASPADGWRVEVGSRGPQDVEVTFKQGEEGGEVQVHGHCSGGEPRFAVERGD